MPPITPTEKLTVGGVPVFIKRDDLYTAPTPLGATPPEGAPPPPFAKPRGLVPYLSKLKDDGITQVAYMDTSISMSGWAVAYYATMLGLKPYIIFPGYKDGPRHNMAKHIELCTRLGAIVLHLDKPAQSSVNYYRARNMMEADYGRVAMLPQGLPFDETVVSMALAINSIPKPALGGTIVIAVGSGTMAAGVVSGLIHHKIDQTVVGVAVSPKDMQRLYRTIMVKAHGLLKGAWCRKHLSVADKGWEYLATPDITAPFPCNPNYDLKAWAWLVDNVQSLTRPILFWNIGA